MCYIFADRHLSNTRWWTTSAQLYDLNPPPVESHKPMKEGFKQFILLGCFHLMFSAMESSIRLITKAINQLQYEKMQDSFENIYLWLIRHLRLRKKYAKLMDVLRLIRNTIHNNEVYLPVSKKGKRYKSRQRSWKGIKCMFPVNRNIKVDNFWELVFVTMPDCLSMLQQIIDSNEASSISYIKDPRIR